MLFRDRNKQVDYLTDKQIREYAKSLLKKFTGYDYEVFTQLNGGSNLLSVYIDESDSVCSKEAYEAYVAFLTKKGLIAGGSYHSLFYALLEEKYNNEKYNFSFTHLTPDYRGSYIIRVRHKKKKPIKIDFPFFKKESDF